jgi:hypothetical protein
MIFFVIILSYTGNIVQLSAQYGGNYHALQFLCKIITGGFIFKK